MNPTVYYIPRQSDFCLLTGAAGCHSSFVTPAGCVHMCLHVPDTESQTLSPPSVPPVATQGCVAQNPTASTDPCNEGVAATGPKPQKRGYAVVVVVIVVALVVVVVSRTLGVFIRAPIASHPIPSHPITSHHIPSHPIPSHPIPSHHITSSHVTSHHTTPHPITPHHITSLEESSCGILGWHFRAQTHTSDRQIMQIMIYLSIVDHLVPRLPL